MIDDAELDTLFTTAPANFIAARNLLARKAQEAGSMNERCSDG
jgi:hypothetical protein